MATHKTKRYDEPHQFDPLMPEQARIGPLLERASDLTRAATALGASAAPAAHQELRVLLRSMNSYYTNRMEGEHTRPSDIDKALQQDFSADDGLARKQRLAVAHIRTEEVCEAELEVRRATGQDSTRWLYSADALMWLHRELFSSLSQKDLALKDGSFLVPGVLRLRDVQVGEHVSPTAASVPAFLERWSAVYGGVRRGEAAIVGVAAAHHRLAWVHPFLDGNGRVARLHTHLVLQSLGLTNGLWSPLRGFARSEEAYRALLHAADEPRRGALDGRGNLTLSGLIAWVDYTLGTCIDQVEFMGRQMDVRGMRDRIAAALSYEESTVKSGVRKESLAPLHYLFATQAQLGRAEFKAMTGLGERVATGMLSALLRRGFLASDTPYGDVRFAVPRHALRFYFPALWPEAEQDQALLQAELKVDETARANLTTAPKT